MTTVSSPIAEARATDLVFTSKNNEVLTDSLHVSTYFGKQHKDVLRKLKQLDCSNDFAERNFTLCFKNNKLQNNKPQPYYKMTKDGFMFLVMGFTGKRAAEIKERYITAFNQMELTLKALPAPEPQSQADYNYPLYTADPTTRFCANVVLTSEIILNQRQPEMELLRQLEQDGYDVRGPKVRLETMYQLIRQYEEIRLAMDEFTHKVSSWADHYKGYVPNRGKNVVFERDGRLL